MKARGWEVTRTNYDCDRRVYAWWHDLPGSKSPTLRISQKVLENCEFVDGIALSGLCLNPREIQPIP